MHHHAGRQGRSLCKKNVVGQPRALHSLATSLDILVDAVALHEPGVKVQDIFDGGFTTRTVNATFEHSVGRLVSVRLGGVMIRVRL